ncbi:hypothetical protein BT96DRAFT_1022405 [Gymnopus androsaceus JB14]|uniref:Uncharacterized protein n=1 Tax=Gymnopus androsaceus JB14 TaxID=1447944 RepID=A0A6A4HAA4_9AGAR|nr:hypothetical protein BT96DRAFT_1022405 [Gymnopus androsaceus JB14]
MALWKAAFFLQSILVLLATIYFYFHSVDECTPSGFYARSSLGPFDLNEAGQHVFEAPTTRAYGAKDVASNQNIADATYQNEALDFEGFKVESSCKGSENCLDSKHNTELSEEDYAWLDLYAVAAAASVYGISKEQMDRLRGCSPERLQLFMATSQ